MSINQFQSQRSSKVRFSQVGTFAINNNDPSFFEVRAQSRKVRKSKSPKKKHGGGTIPAKSDPVWGNVAMKHIVYLQSPRMKQQAKKSGKALGTWVKSPNSAKFQMFMGG